tara:strand:+ start:1056 stop:1454 length:399 start_codon:yes stop_codon:yes gene_type:complete
MKKNIKLGKNKIIWFLLIFWSLVIFTNSYAENDLEGDFTIIKILDKISSKNNSIILKNGKELIFKDLSIKSMKCSNSEFDDNPEIKAYIQVIDLTNKKKDNVFIFNGWMFSSSPSIRPFDHPVYDIWLIGCN